MTGWAVLPTIALLFVHLILAGCRHSSKDAQVSSPQGLRVAQEDRSRPVCFVSKVSGDVRYRRAGSLNWEPLGDRKNLFMGDLLFTRKNSYIHLEYSNAGASLRLPPETLFRMSERPPVFTKMRRRFGLEGSSDFPQKQIVKNNDKAENPFDQFTDSSEKRKSLHIAFDSVQPLKIVRKKVKVPLDFPQSNSAIIASQYPVYLPIRVSPEFMGQKYWAYLWTANDPVNPIWSGFSNGEFSSIPVPGGGKYVVQVMNEDETFVSESVEVSVIDSAKKSENERGKAKKDILSDVLLKLKDKREEDYIILME
jgi:hypothetical protein